VGSAAYVEHVLIKGAAERMHRIEALTREGMTHVTREYTNAKGLPKFWCWEAHYVCTGRTLAYAAQHVNVIAGMNQLTSNVPRDVFASASPRFEALDHDGDPHGCRRQLERRRENQTPPNAARPKDATSVKPLGRAALQAGVEQVRPRQ